MIPDDVVEQVSQQADIVAVIGEHVRLRKVGSVWRGPCPFHQGTNANFSVVPGGGYKCFVCGETGSVFTFLQKRLGMSFVEAVKHVGAKAGIEVQEVQRRREGPDPREPLWELQATAAEFFQRSLWDDPAGAAARAYLAEREVPRDLAERFGLGYAPRELGAMRRHLADLGFDDARQLAAGLLVRREENEEPRPRFRDRLLFPIHDTASHVVGFGGRLLGPGEPKYLNSAESEVFSKGKLLYHLAGARHAIRRDERAIVVEGYFDVLRLVAAGIEGVVAPMGTALTDAQAEVLARLTRNVVLLYDSDAAGQRATFRAADVLLAKGIAVRVVTLPEGEDPDTFARREGRGPVERLLDDALDVFDRKVQLLERAGWFADLQHKRRALDRLLPTIRAASDPVTRDLYLARAAEASGVGREVLLSELHVVRRGAGRRVATPAPDRGSAAVARGGEEAAGGTDAAARGASPSTEPYRSTVERGSAEQSLLRVLLTHPRHRDRIIEEVGKLEMEDLPPGAAEAAAAADALSDEAQGAFQDPVFRAIYEAVVAVEGEDDAAEAEALADRLDPVALRAWESLRAEREAVVDAEATIADALRQLRGRAVDARLRALESLLPLAGPDEKDGVTLAIKRLADEKRALGVQHWGSVRRRR